MHTEFLTDPPSPEFIAPPFNANAADVAIFAPELTGFRVLSSMARRLGWPSLSGKRIFDFGCGVRMARTIINLNLDVGLYAGVDVDASFIEWLQANIDDPRMMFARVDDHNPMYNPAGMALYDRNDLKNISMQKFDVASMFSVITHQDPEEARRTFSMLHDMMRGQGNLYFTSFLNSEISDYCEGHESLRMKSVFNPDFLSRLVGECGWRVDRIYNPGDFQMYAFACSAAG